jgi:hypothetical protein
MIKDEAIQVALRTGVTMDRRRIQTRDRRELSRRDAVIPVFREQLQRIPNNLLKFRGAGLFDQRLERRLIPPHVTSPSPNRDKI